jgi:hypothetical protein
MKSLATVGKDFHMSMSKVTWGFSTQSHPRVGKNVRLQVKWPLLLSQFSQNGMRRQVLEKLLNIKLREKLFEVSRVVIHRKQTDIAKRIGTFCKS